MNPKLPTIVIPGLVPGIHGSAAAVAGLGPPCMRACGFRATSAMDPGHKARDDVVLALATSIG